MSNFAEIKSANSFLEITHPKTGEPIGLRVEILPPDSEIVRSRVRAIRDARQHKERRGIVVTASEQERISIDLCVTAVVDWQWTKPIDEANYNGEQPSFAKSTLAEMLKTLEWMRRQIDDHLGDEKNFF